MTEFKKGDLVKVVRKFRSDEGDLCWMPAMDKLVGTTAKVERIYVDGDVYLDCGWWFYPRVLEHVGKSHAACILTEKVTVGGVPCRKILGFEGILSYDELPGKYMDGEPSFDLYKSSASHYEFDGYGMQWKSVDGTTCAVSYNIPRDSDPIIELGPLPVHVLTVGDIYPEVTFQAIVVWLKRAGSRLAKIRKQEKDAWSGKETVEI
jgi:hypothetical protein